MVFASLTVFPQRLRTSLTRPNDVVAEARRESKIDAAVRARLAELEEGIRAEVTKQVDGRGRTGIIHALHNY